MNQPVIDTDKVLKCRQCHQTISRIEDKVVIGARINARQHFYTFHSACWESVRLAFEHKK